MQNILPLITGSAGALVVLAIIAYMFFTDKIHSEAEFQRVVLAFTQEKEAHERTRHALELASASAQAGMKPAELLAAVFELTKERERAAQERT
jgi:hypothetical protein